MSHSSTFADHPTDILVQLVIAPDSGSPEQLPQDPWESIVSGLEALGGPIDQDDSRTLSVEEVPLIQADLTYGDILREGSLSHLPRPSLLAKAKPHRASTNTTNPTSSACCAASNGVTHLRHADTRLDTGLTRPTRTSTPPSQGDEKYSERPWKRWPTPAASSWSTPQRRQCPWKYRRLVTHHQQQQWRHAAAHAFASCRQPLHTCSRH
jgi:hypothetical protein